MDRPSYGPFPNGTGTKPIIITLLSHRPFRLPESLSIATMDGLQLRDEAVRDRIRLAEEFLDPSKSHSTLYADRMEAENS